MRLHTAVANLYIHGNETIMSIYSTPIEDLLTFGEMVKRHYEKQA